MLSSKRKMSKLKVLDLFCGAGGFSLGFRDEGFSVTGVDINPKSGEIFTLNKIGDFFEKDLTKENITGEFDVIIGGPPCRPWSSINVKRRGIRHPDYSLLKSFFHHIFSLKPQAFLMENVPPLSGDPGYISLIEKTAKEGYSVSFRRINYGHYGIGSQRKRLFTAGFREFGNDANSFFEKMENLKIDPITIHQAIGKYEHFQMDEFPDHIWPQLNTIEKYREHYETGKFGWHKLKYDESAPSFGNVMKTYILHPNAGNENFPVRVISVREVLELLGFPSSYVFPSNMAMGMKYQMAADSVSPLVSRQMAFVLKQIIENRSY